MAKEDSGNQGHVTDGLLWLEVRTNKKFDPRWHDALAELGRRDKLPTRIWLLLRLAEAAGLEPRLTYTLDPWQLELTETTTYHQAAELVRADLRWSCSKYQVNPALLEDLWRNLRQRGSSTPSSPPASVVGSTVSQRGTDPLYQIEVERIYRSLWGEGTSAYEWRLAIPAETFARTSVGRVLQVDGCTVTIDLQVQSPTGSRPSVPPQHDLDLALLPLDTPNGTHA